MAKFQMTISDGLNEYCKREAERIGISKNAFIAFCVENDRKQREAITMTTNAKIMFDTVQETEKQ